MEKKHAQTPPTFDAHIHFPASRGAAELEPAGAALAMTMSPDEGETALARSETGRADAAVAWGVGCHPGAVDAQRAFDPDRFRGLVARAAVIGEVGLDFASAVPRELQLEVFRIALDAAARLKRPVSVHSQHANHAALDEIERVRPPAVVLHWWTGSDGETARAVALGAWFSVPEALAESRDWSALVPADRILVETDNGYDDPPASVPEKLARTERLLARQYGLDDDRMRRLVWRNFGNIVRRTGIIDLLPGGIVLVLDRLERDAGS